jgi:response regulator of citrate/malate metabolism
VIWLDHYLLGKENGLDFVSWCKNEEKQYKNIPIFVVSNTATPEKVQTYLRLGINKYYVKAEKRLEEIINEINSFLENPEE